MRAKNSNIWFWVLGIVAVGIIAWAIYGAGHVTKIDAVSLTREQYETYQADRIERDQLKAAYAEVIARQEKEIARVSLLPTPEQIAQHIVDNEGKGVTYPNQLRRAIETAISVERNLLPTPTLGDQP